jgi:hypothetical protein
MDPFNPGTSLLTKLGSALRHADEALGEGGQPVDKSAFFGILADPEVEEWMAAMDAAALLPVKR